MKDNIISSEVLIKEFNLGYQKALKENPRKRMYQLGYLDALKEIEISLDELNKHKIGSVFKCSFLIKQELNKLKEKFKE